VLVEIACVEVRVEEEEEEVVLVLLAVEATVSSGGGSKLWWSLTGFDPAPAQYPAPAWCQAPYRHQLLPHP